MSPLGGVIADRVNKRNIMVVLDFTTAGIILLFLLLSRQVNLVALILVTLILLFSISGLYQRLYRQVCRSWCRRRSWCRQMP